MGIRTIRTQEDDFLRKKSKKVEKIDARILSILDDMVDTMNDDNGLGLAAVQVGILRRLVCIDVTPVLKEDIAELDKKLNGEFEDEEEAKSFDKALAEEKKAELKRMLDYGLLKLINPEIISAEGEEEDIEGCLSVPGWQGIVKRPKNITVKALDVNGIEQTYTATGVLKKAFCHELDHLEGILYIDIARDLYELSGDDEE